jgi:hypothetical protein
MNHDLLLSRNSPESEANENPVEVSPGVIERRYFLRSSIATAASLLLLGAATRSLSAQNIPATGRLSWDAFLKQAVPVAQQLFADPAFSVDEYLYRLGSLATRLEEIPDTKLCPYQAVEPRMLFAPSFKGTPFIIIQWRIEPGAMFPAHNHPNASVCNLGYQGQARLRNFQIVGEAPAYDSKKTFRIQETHNELITRGRINGLSPSRDNIHLFQPGKEGARGIDITTLHGKNAPFSFLDIGEKPAGSEQRIFEAAWRSSTSNVQSPTSLRGR